MKVISIQTKRLIQLARKVTVEPLLPLYIIASVLTAYAAQNLYLDKGCRVNLGYSDEVCDAMMRKEDTNHKEIEIEVQQLVTKMQSWKIIIQSFIPCLFILFVGSWSDRHVRRKPCMLIPIFGELLSSAGLAMCFYFKNVPMEYAGLIEAVFEGLTGGWATMLMGAFSYVADITTEEERTLRIGIANTFFSIGLPIGMASVGILLRLTGFYGVFIISAIIHLINFIYGCLWIKESAEYNKIIKNKPVQIPEHEVTQVSTNPAELSVKKPRKNFICDFFDPTSPIETLKVIFIKGKTVKIVTLLIVVLLVVGPMHGEQAVMYLYTRLKFNWNEVDYSFYYTYSTLTTMVGTITTIYILSTVLKLHDALIGVIGSLSKICASFVYAFAVKSMHFYFGPAVEFIHYASFIAMRSIASKTVEKEERARLNSLVGLIESLAPSIYGPIYSWLYRHTITFFPGAFYFVGSGLKVIALCIFLKMYITYKTKQKRCENLEVASTESMESSAENGKNKPIYTISDLMSVHS